MPFKLEVVADVGEEVWFIHPTTYKAVQGVVKGIEVNRLSPTVGDVHHKARTCVSLDVEHRDKGSGLKGTLHNVDGDYAFQTKEALLGSL